MMIARLLLETEGFVALKKGTPLYMKTREIWEGLVEGGLVLRFSRPWTEVVVELLTPKASKSHY